MNSKFYLSAKSQQEPEVCSSNESIDDSGAVKQVSHQEKNSIQLSIMILHIHLF